MQYVANFESAEGTDLGASWGTMRKVLIDVQATSDNFPGVLVDISPVTDEQIVDLRAQYGF